MSVRKQIFQLKVTLKDIKPPIWRRIQVPGSYSFWDLHVAIQDAMGWLDYHLHEFRLRDQNGRGLSLGIPEGEFDSEIQPGWEYQLPEYLNLVHPTCEYVYDFGDDWRHKLALEQILPAEPGVAYPRCLKGRRACPPEDCGGPWGYQELLEVLADPAHAQYRESLEWVESLAEGAFDPEAFEPAAVVFSNPRERFELAFSDE
jgi:Plasmid pRiA4b ORF-3-like protein